MNMPSYNQIVPNDIQERLIAIRDQETAGAWEIGDICWVLQAYVEQQQTQYIGLMDIYSAVGCFAGKSSRTVREYAMLSKFFPQEIREAYGVLSINHFRKAHSCGTMWRVALEWCIEIGEMTGRPATVDALEVYISQNLSRYQGEDENNQVVGQPAEIKPNLVTQGAVFFESLFNRARSMKKAIMMSRPPELSDEEFETIHRSLCSIEHVLEGKLKVVIDKNS